MQPVPPSVLSRIDLKAAIRAEAKTDRNLIPPEPGWDKLRGAAADIAQFAHNSLQIGMTTAPECELSARKPGHGVRPIPYWGPIERACYRALVDAALDGQPDLDRSPKAWLKFVRAPMDYGVELQKAEGPKGRKGNLFFFLSSPIKYVVKADLAGFYQFVDHGILAEELIAQGVDYDVVRTLTELLGEVQGRNIGLPQLYDPSDRLSEVYADRIERDVIRSGYATWRFNDDFRIACRSYTEALEAIEALDRAARRAGLLLNESKTLTFGFGKYMLDHLGLTESAEGAINPQDVEDIVGDYTDDFVGDPDAALRLVSKASTNPKDKSSVDLRRATHEDVRLLRRAIAALTEAGSGGALAHLKDLLEYIPALTPSLCNHLVAIGKSGTLVGDVAETIDDLIVVQMNDWQRSWLVYVVTELSLLADGSPGDVEARTAWIEKSDASELASPLRAQAFFALASAGLVPTKAAVARTASGPQALVNFYATAAARSVDASSKEDKAVIGALAGDTPVLKALTK